MAPLQGEQSLCIDLLLLIPTAEREQGEEREPKVIRRFQAEQPGSDCEVKEWYSLETDAEMQYMPLSWINCYVDLE